MQMFGEETDISCRLYKSSPKPQSLSIHIVVTKKNSKKSKELWQNMRRTGRKEALFLLTLLHLLFCGVLVLADVALPKLTNEINDARFAKHINEICNPL